VPAGAAEKARNPKADATAWRAEHGLFTEKERRKDEARRAAVRASELSVLSSGFESGRGSFGAQVLSPGLPSVLPRAAFSGAGSGHSIDEADESGVPIVRVPDVIGLSLREAMEAMEKAGIPWRQVQAKGHGFVTSQTPDSGAKYKGVTSRIKLDLDLFQREE
jgi:hypothetical protein